MAIAGTASRFLGSAKSLVSFSLKRQSSAILPKQCFSSSCLLHNLEASSSGSVPPPCLENVPKVYDDKIVSIVNNISDLTLREVADLNELLKSTLNITDVPMMAAAAASPSAAPAQEEVVEEKVPEKTEFAIRLVEFNAPDKIKLIKAIKSIKKELNLVQAKKFVESLPQIVRDDASKEESEEIQKLIESAGGKVTIS